MSELAAFNTSYETNYAHGEGFTYLCYHKDGTSFITGGVDGEVRRWMPDNLEYDTESFSIGAPIFSLCVKDESFFVAADSNDLKEYSLKDGSFVETKARFTSSIYCLDISVDKKYLAAGGGDFVIKILNLEDGSLRTLSGHEAPLLSVSLDPQSSLLASSSCDGTVRVWHIESLECIKKFEKNHSKSNDLLNSSTWCKLSWDRKGNNLLIPSDNAVNVYQKNTWNLQASFRQQNFENICICSTSLFDKYLAASNKKGFVVLWDYSKPNSAPLAIFSNPKQTSITCLAWHSTISEKLAACDDNGEYHIIFIGQEKTMELPKSYESMLLNFDLDEDLMEESTNETNLSRKKSQTIFDDSDDEESSKSIESTKKAESNDNELEDEDDNEIDIGAIKAIYEPKIFGDDKTSDAQNAKAASSFDITRFEQAIKKMNEIKQPIMQPAFQPGSTPVSFQERYMIWNSIGIVRSHQTEEESNIDVEFHDTTVHHSLHLPNTDNYIMADLSTEALILANSFYEDSSSSRLFCMGFNIWDTNREWKYDLPEDEFIEAIALGEGLIVVATDKKNIRLFTIGGLQIYIFTISGPVVCLSAQEQSVMIIYHSGSGLPGEQCLSMLILKIDPKNLFKKKHQIYKPIPVALSPKAFVSWCGFTDEGTPCIMDSEGIVRLYKDLIGHFWVPIANTKQHLKSKQDNYFIIGLTEIQEQIRCISCKGSRYPPLVPRPAPVMLNFELSLCDRETTKSKLEEQYIKYVISSSLLKSLYSKGFEVEFQMDLADKKLNETLIKLFALAVNTECDTLSIEIAHLMESQKTLEGALRYVTQKRKTGVAHKLNKIIEEKLKEHEDEGNEGEEEEISNSFVPSPSKGSAIRDTNVDDVQLKPKPLTKINKRSSSNVEAANDNCTLKPKHLNFKEKCKRSLDDDNDDLNEETLQTAFDNFIEAKREEISENYCAQDDYEVKRIAKRIFNKLSSEDKMAWSLKNKASKSTNPKKQKV